jgi:hypothetical protein
MLPWLAFHGSRSLGQIGRRDLSLAKQLSMAQPEKEAEDSAPGRRAEEEPASLRHGDKAHGQHSQNNY